MIALLVVAAFLILVPLLTYIASRRLIGQTLEHEIPASGEGDRMIYFYSPKCGPCRSMTPIVDQLSAQHDCVFKVDILQHRETALAFNIRATPTTILVKDNRVLDVALGAKTQAQLEALLRRVA
jgi:thioredoxin-like negative regulator of GroEL